MAKSDTKKIIKYLAEGNSLRRTSLLSGTSLGKVQKVVRMTEGLDRMNEGLATPELKPFDSIEEQKVAPKFVNFNDNEIRAMSKITMREWIYLPKNLYLHESDEAREKFLEEDEAMTREGVELEAQRKANL